MSGAPIPIVDLFAGAGGLSEGFTSFLPSVSTRPDYPIRNWDSITAVIPTFQVATSIELDPWAHRTLMLRSFFRLFQSDPQKYEQQIELYYQGCQKSDSPFNTNMKDSSEYLDHLLKYFFEEDDEKVEVRSEILKEVGLKPSALGSVDGSEEYYSGEEVHARIENALGDVLTKDEPWVLTGGPPCQAYSVVGRSRSVGSSEQRDLRNQIETLRTELQSLKQVSLFESKNAEVKTTKEKRRQEIEAELAKCEADLRQIKNESQESFDQDHRNFLYQAYVEILAKFQPPIFVMENVKGMLSASNVKDEKIFEQIKKDVSEPAQFLGQVSGKMLAKYKLVSFPVGAEIESNHDFLIRCEKFGVPQLRHRVLILGVREDYWGRINQNRKGIFNQCFLPKIKSFPKRSEKLKRHFTANLSDAIDDLPEIRSDISYKSGKEQQNYSSWIKNLFKGWKTFRRAWKDCRIDLPAKLVDFEAEVGNLGTGENFFEGEPASEDSNAHEYSKALKDWYHDPRLKGQLHHVARKHILEDIQRYFYCSATIQQKYGTSTVDGDDIFKNPSPKLDSFDRSFLPNHANLYKDGKKRTSDFEDRFRVQVWDRPATTITSHLQKDGHFFIHPDPKQARSLTARECARIQTFPDNFFFVGSRTRHYVQIGNAVPPILAAQLANVVHQYIDLAQSKTNKMATPQIAAEELQELEAAAE
jgi:DNA (cytosine-5)-methyltransferase 1